MSIGQVQAEAGATRTHSGGTATELPAQPFAELSAGAGATGKAPAERWVESLRRECLDRLLTLRPPR
jgi:hypothetical protein